VLYAAPSLVFAGAALFCGFRLAGGFVLAMGQWSASGQQLETLQSAFAVGITVPNLTDRGELLFRETQVCDVFCNASIL